MTYYLQDKDLNIVYCPGRESTNADGLSRQFEDEDQEDLPQDKSSSTSGFRFPNGKLRGDVEV